MKRLLITEEERKHIKLLYEKIGEPLGTTQQNSPKGKSVIEMKKFFNQYYKLNLPLNGDWQTKEYNDVIKRYIEEKKLQVWVCSTGDGYCPDNSDGEVTTKQLGELNNFIKQDKAKFTQTQGNEKTNTTNDKNYDYMLKDGKYYFKGKQGTTAGVKYPNWVEATGKGLESIKSIVKF
jgi:hypothetical protein